MIDRSKNFRNSSNGSSGSALLIVMIIGTIIGMIAIFNNQVRDTVISAQSRSKLAADKSLIKKVLIMAVSCNSTLPSGTCTVGSLVSVKHKKPDNTLTTIIENSGTGTRYGAYAVRAICNADGKSISLQAAVLKPGENITSTSTGSFNADPLTGKIITWDNSQSNLNLPADRFCFGGGNVIGPDLGQCTTVTVPFLPDEVVRTYNCPSTHPYFVGTWLTQEDTGKKSDCHRKMECCKKF